MGIIILIILSLVSYKFVFKFYWLAYIFNLVLLVYAKLNGDVNKGAGRWIDLKFMQFQPSELSKIILILFLPTMLLLMPFCNIMWNCVENKILN